jgi:hypothetical protein
MAALKPPILICISAMSALYSLKCLMLTWEIPDLAAHLGDVHPELSIHLAVDLMPGKIVM